MRPLPLFFLWTGSTDAGWTDEIIELCFNPGPLEFPLLVKTVFLVLLLGLGMFLASVAVVCALPWGFLKHQKELGEGTLWPIRNQARAKACADVRTRAS